MIEVFHNCFEFSLCRFHFDYVWSFMIVLRTEDLLWIFRWKSSFVIYMMFLQSWMMYWWGIMLYLVLLIIQNQSVFIESKYLINFIVLLRKFHLLHSQANYSLLRIDLHHFRIGIVVLAADFHNQNNARFDNWTKMYNVYFLGVKLILHTIIENIYP